MSHVHSELLRFYENTCQMCYHLKKQPNSPVCFIRYENHGFVSCWEHHEIIKFRQHYSYKNVDFIFDYPVIMNTWAEFYEEFLQTFIEDLDDNGMLPCGMLEDYISNEFI